MSRVRLHQRMMRNGWAIPRRMEWLFWPLRFGLIEDDGGRHRLVELRPEGAIDAVPMERRYLTADGLSIFRNVDLRARA